MADPVLTPEEIAAARKAKIAGLKQLLDRGVVENRDASGRFVKRNLEVLERRLNEYEEEDNAGAEDPTLANLPVRARQIRMIGRKGY